MVYDERNNPIESLSICLDCNNYDTYPGSIKIEYSKPHLIGFSKETRNKLRNIFKEWGLEYYGFSSFYDDEEDYELYLKSLKE